jgi:hypothetical protein
MKINGELTIRNIDKIVNEFMDEFSSGKKVIVKSESIDSIDITGIQFLLSLIKLSFEDKSKVQLNINVGNESRILIEKNGFKDIFNYISNK